MCSGPFLRDVSPLCGRLDVRGVVRRCVASSSESEPLAHRTAAAAAAAAHTGCPALKASPLSPDNSPSHLIRKGDPLYSRHKQPQQRFEMIKNGHHQQHQGSAAAGKDAGMTPGAAACSPEKRRRRIRVWCDGW